MSFSTFLVVIVVLMFIMAYYSTNKKRNQILCRYSGKDKTIEQKWLNADKGYVIFRGRKFDVITRRIQSFWFTSGIHYLFPTKVNYQEWSWYSRFPHDPDNYENVWETPEVRDAINTSELVQSFYKTTTPTATKKKSMLEAYLPFIILIVVVLGGFFLYTNIQGIAAHVASMQNQINSIAK